MKWYIKIVIAVFIIAAVTLGICLLGTVWLSFLYTTILALFPNEIKSCIKSIFLFFKRNKQIRVSYSYLFRIQYKNLHLLVRDEQGRNDYHPVGGVYKYYPSDIDIEEEFDGEYDGLYDINLDTDNDLRLIIGRKKIKAFNSWFNSFSGRENYTDISREFKEELISTKLLSENVFKTITYKYVGSCSKSDVNKQLKMKQIRHFDIFTLRLTDAQKKQLEALRNKNNRRYIFASEKEIESGKVSYGGQIYLISNSSKYVLLKNADILTQEINFTNDISVTLI